MQKSWKENWRCCLMTCATYMVLSFSLVLSSVALMPRRQITVYSAQNLLIIFRSSQSTSKTPIMTRNHHLCVMTQNLRYTGRSCLWLALECCRKQEVRLDLRNACVQILNLSTGSELVSGQCWCYLTEEIHSTSLFHHGTK